MLSPPNHVAALIQGSDGNFYGAIRGGDDFPYGAIFCLTRAGKFTVLHTFGNIGGMHPSASLIQGSDGNFYGTTSQGGIANAYAGAVFRLTRDGTLTTLHYFNGVTEGDGPEAALIQGKDGSLYGTTAFGGDSNHSGTVFRMTTSGELTTLHQFNKVDGANPFGGVIQARDGSFYGMTHNGGDEDNGIIYRLTPTGAFTVLHRFNGSDGMHPSASLIQAGDGSFYGVTAGSYPRDNGTIFRITAEGVLTTLHRFDGSDGNFPAAALVQAKDGNFYGTTVNGGGANGYGVAFRLTPAGEFTVIHRFDLPDGGPRAALIQANDGKLYGTTSGGKEDRGTVFCLTLEGKYSVVLTPMTP